MKIRDFFEKKDKEIAGIYANEVHNLTKKDLVNDARPEINKVDEFKPYDLDYYEKPEKADIYESLADGLDFNLNGEGFVKWDAQRLTEQEAMPTTNLVELLLKNGEKPVIEMELLEFNELINIQNNSHYLLQAQPKAFLKLGNKPIAEVAVKFDYAKLELTVSKLLI